MNVCPPGGAVAETVDVIITVSCNAGQKPKTKVTLKTEQEGVGWGGGGCGGRNALESVVR